jgi:acetate kinase
MKKRKILVFNVGSSSIKYSLFEETKKIFFDEYERLNTKNDFRNALGKIFKNFDNVDLIAHRVVHGGNLKQPSRINKQIKEEIKKFSELAPLHNPYQLMAIQLCELYKKPQYAAFDTMFFSPIPKVADIYPIPMKIIKKYEIQRYGFHGLSHEYASKNLKGKTIVCHLGSGSSISAIINSKPIDTSMGFTPLDGIMMSTRSGAIDPGIIFFLQKRKYNMEKILVEQSGLKGISKYCEFKDILKNMQKDKNCKLAYEIFVYQIIKTIGAYAAAMNGLDNLVFTGKIGENCSVLRQDVCKNLTFLNKKPKIIVKKTDEEKIILEKVLKIL